MKYVAALLATYSLAVSWAYSLQAQRLTHILQVVRMEEQMLKSTGDTCLMWYTMTKKNLRLEPRINRLSAATSGFPGQ